MSCQLLFFILYYFFLMMKLLTLRSYFENIIIKLKINKNVGINKPFPWNQILKVQKQLSNRSPVRWNCLSSDSSDAPGDPISQTSGGLQEDNSLLHLKCINGSLAFNQRPHYQTTWAQQESLHVGNSNNQPRMRL